MTVRVLLTDGRNKAMPFGQIDALVPGDEGVTATAETGQDGVAVFTGLDNTLEWFFRPHQSGLVAHRQGIARLNSFESPVNHGASVLGSDYNLLPSDGSLPADDHTLDTGLELTTTVYGGTLHIEFSGVVSVISGTAPKLNQEVTVWIRCVIFDGQNEYFTTPAYEITTGIGLDVGFDYITSLHKVDSAFAKWRENIFPHRPLPLEITVRIQAYLDDSSDAGFGQVQVGSALQVTEFISNNDLIAVLNGDITQVPEAVPLAASALSRSSTAAALDVV